MVGATNVAVVATAAVLARKRRIEFEKDEYNKIVSSIDDLVEQGIDENIWVVETNVSGLPEYDYTQIGKIKDFVSSLYHSLKIVGPPHKLHKESTEDYVRSLFPLRKAKYLRLPIYYQENNILVAKVEKLYLLFYAKSRMPVSRQRNWVFFRPEYPLESGTHRIERTTEVRTHETYLRYKDFTKDIESLGNLKGISFPHEVIYK
jgi:hypothetical protein